LFQELLRSTRHSEISVQELQRSGWEQFLDTDESFPHTAHRENGTANSPHNRYRSFTRSDKHGGKRFDR